MLILPKRPCVLYLFAPFVQSFVQKPGDTLSLGKALLEAGSVWKAMGQKSLPGGLRMCGSLTFVKSSFSLKGWQSFCYYIVRYIVWCFSPTESWVPGTACGHQLASWVPCRRVSTGPKCNPASFGLQHEGFFISSRR